MSKEVVFKQIVIRDSQNFSFYCKKCGAAEIFERKGMKDFSSKINYCFSISYCLECMHASWVYLVDEWSSVPLGKLSPTIGMFTSGFGVEFYLGPIKIPLRGTILDFCEKKEDLPDEITHLKIEYEGRVLEIPWKDIVGENCIFMPLA